MSADLLPLHRSRPHVRPMAAEHLRTPSQRSVERFVQVPRDKSKESGAPIYLFEFTGNTPDRVIVPAPPIKFRHVATGAERKEAGYPTRPCNCCAALFKPRGSVQRDCQTCIDRIPKRLRAANKRLSYSGVRISPVAAAGRFNCRDLRKADELRERVEGAAAAQVYLAFPDGTPYPVFARPDVGSDGAA